MKIKLDHAEVLFELGDTSDDVYLVLSGELEIIAPTPSGPEVRVGRIGPDELVGELTAVLGGSRSATVRALGETTVERYEREAFEAWLDASPHRTEAIARLARSRIDRTRVLTVLTELVGTDRPDVVEEVADAVDWVSLRAGDLLFAQGDESDAAYVLVAGQMRISAVDEFGDQEFDLRIGRGDLVGEFGIIDDAPRSASVRAIRDCTLARISRDSFEDITSRHPALMLPVVRRVLQQKAVVRRNPAHAGTIAVAVTASNPPVDLLATILDEIGRHGTTDVLNLDRLASIVRSGDIANADPASAGEARLSELIHEFDVANRWLILECSEPDHPWTHRALRTADRVVVVASAFPNDAERRAIAAIRTTVEATHDYELWVAQVNPYDGDLPHNSTALLDRVGASRIVHIRRDHPPSIRRLARLISGTGVGVALSGGGARSFAQLGALRVLAEHGVPIDALAGTSMGSVIGAATAMADDIEGAIAMLTEAFAGARLLDYTVPVTSMFAGKRLADKIAEAFDPYRIVDLRVPFTAISTNLSKACVVEHRNGSLAKAIRASVSLPGVFPPVVDGDDLLIDGGVLENLPARPLRQDPGIGTVIAIDVAPPGGPRAKGDYGQAVTARELVRARMRGAQLGNPALATTLISSMLVGSSQSRRASLDNGDIDLYLSLNLSGVKLLDFGALSSAIERGYVDASQPIADWAGAYKSA